MKTIIFLTFLVASINCQQSAFESFMSRNRELFTTSGSSQFASSAQPQPQIQAQPQPQIQHQWQHPTPVARSNQFLPSLPSNEPFVTSNSHIQAFNSPQAPAGPTTTISGPNFQTSINLPAIPALPTHAGQSAPQQQSQFQPQQQSQFQPQQQPQFQQQLPQFQQPQQTQQPQSQFQFTSHVHNHQFPSSAPLVNQPSAASTSFFNTQGNNNGFPSSFTAQPNSNLPTPPQTFGPLDFSSFQGSNSFFNNQRQQQQAQPTASPFASSAPSTSTFGGPTAIRAPGFETFVFMRPSDQPVQGASLRKVIRSTNGIDKEMFYVPMPSYSPPSIFTTQIVHANENRQGQQQ